VRDVAAEPFDPIPAAGRISHGSVQGEAVLVTVKDFTVSGRATAGSTIVAVRRPAVEPKATR
jgi:hypothetical protein